MHLLPWSRRVGILALKGLTSKKISFESDLETLKRVGKNFAKLQDAHETP